MPIGSVEKVGDLNIDVASVVALIDRRWQSHPDCRSVTKETCIARPEKQEVVSPVSIANDKQLTQVFSNM